MLKLIARRLSISIFLLIIVSLLTFLLQALTPGDTARTLLGDNYTPQAYAQLRRQLGLEQPLLVQYWHWLSDAVRGNLGTSPISGLSVRTEVVARLGVTLSLIIGTVVVVAVVGVGLGVLSAVRNGVLGRAVDTLALLGFALPAFWVGLVLVTVFAVYLRVLPATGYVPLGADPVGWLGSLVLPVAALGFGGVAVVAKQTRSAMLDVLSREFVHTMRANGASEVSIVLRHGLRNAAIPVVTVLGLLFVSLLSGTVFVETVFAMPGLGGLIVQSTTQHDLPMVQGVVVVFTAIVVVANLLVDLAYGWLDPKVRVQ